ncbi:MAG: hypothetical protein QMD22_05985 [archaeon]|nr:hypothetical protein [archaeon]
MDLKIIIAILNENSGAINGILLSILILVTIYYARSTHKLVKLEEKREKGKKGSF